jgi:hypothetical protein
MSVHTEECGERTAIAEQLIAEYKASWPKYCQHCGGLGVVTYQENQAPIGSGMVWNEETAEVCDECIGKGMCPRCGEYISEPWCVNQMERCPKCGFLPSEDGGIPSQYECNCWEKDLPDNPSFYPFA